MSSTGKNWTPVFTDLAFAEPTTEPTTEAFRLHLFLRFAFDMLAYLRTFLFLLCQLSQ